MMSESYIDKRWYVAQTKPNAEGRAEQELIAQGFQVFLPRFLKKRRHARKVTTMAAPLFPSYLFVALDPAAQRWRSINGTVGVARLVMGADSPAPVARGVVEELIRRLNPKGFIDLVQRAALVPGDTVRICAGSFAATLGLFEDYTDRDRVAILLDLLGRKVRVFVDEGLVVKEA
jgi:transcriptional antiterminator RfaH